MLDEFEDQRIVTIVQLDAYEADRQRQEDDHEHNEDVGAVQEDSGSTAPLNQSQQEAVESTQLVSELQDKPTSVNTNGRDEEESNLFDILEEDVSDIGEDDRTEEDQVEDITGDRILITVIFITTGLKRTEEDRDRILITISFYLVLSERITQSAIPISPTTIILIERFGDRTFDLLCLTTVSRYGVNTAVGVFVTPNHYSIQ